MDKNFRIRERAKVQFRAEFFNLFAGRQAWSGAVLWQQIRMMRSDRVLWLACLGNTYFFFLAALVQFGVIDYGQDVLKVDAVHTTRLWAACLWS